MPNLNMERVQFKINAAKYSVGSEISSGVTLLEYIREHLELRGTKFMCQEGGCGVCIVSVIKKPGDKTISVNACLVLIISCHGWDITTIEGIGNKKDGYDIVQKTLAENNGTQCGYCSPGMVMAMHSLKMSNKNMTKLDIEKSFGSNICRCTGYRPVLEAFKKFATDEADKNNVLDIEDLKICQSDHKCKDTCNKDDWCFVTDAFATYKVIDMKDGKKYCLTESVDDIFDIFDKEGTSSYMLMSGNTAKGAYPILEYPTIIIDTTNITELKGYSLDQNIVIGSNNTLSELMQIFNEVKSNDDFKYLEKLYDHIELVAHIPIRNLGSIAGNLMTKHSNNEFPSDIFLLFVTVGAMLTIQTKSEKLTVHMEEFINMDMKGKVIINAMLPPMGEDYKLTTFKVRSRSQNAIAYVNAGILVKLKQNNIVENIRIVYGGLSKFFVRASKTEALLVGKNLFTNTCLQDGLKSLKKELIVEDRVPFLSIEYRKKLALGLFYKGLLILCPDNIMNFKYRSGKINLHETRPVSKAKQIYTTDKNLYPLNEPIMKVEAMVQCAGEIPYTDDIPKHPREVHAAFVLSTVALADIENIDTSEALNYPGVLAFYSASDVPGTNAFTPGNAFLACTSDEEFLCEGKVKYNGQTIGIIVAENQRIADIASKLIKIKYSNIKIPTLDIKVTKENPNRVRYFFAIDSIVPRGINIAKVIKSNMTIRGQYHFTMENLVSLSKPTSDGLEVHVSTQWLDGVQTVVARALNLQDCQVDVYVSRIGGGYGMKISRPNLLAVATSLVATKMNRPCRMVMPLTTAMKALGKRLPSSVDFEAAVSSSGVVQYLNIFLYDDTGYQINEPLLIFTIDCYNSCYNSLKWNYKSYYTTTDTAVNTWCRAPGTMELISMLELIMERISYELSLDPLEVRLSNLNILHLELREMINNLKVEADYSTRRAAVDKFNKENRWKKRGLRFSIMRWAPLGDCIFDMNMSVFHDDGTIVITHAGVEMGQGVNTKAIQVCAYMLKIPIHKIKIKSNNTIVAPNSYPSSSSLTSQSVLQGVKKCCEELLLRLAPARLLAIGASWEKLIETAYRLQIDLQVHAHTSFLDLQFLNIYGVTLAEVEVDMLTGETEILRVDLVEDVGQSVSPEIDVGQVEGAFIMGLGYWMTEHLVYDKDTGELLTNRTWTYHVPQARDIPQDFRVYFKKNSYSNPFVLGAKPTGEAPICLSVAIPLAVREAISAVRKDGGFPTTEWFEIDGPYTLEKILMSAATNTEDFKFN